MDSVFYKFFEVKGVIMVVEAPNAIKIFCCYATEDKELCEELIKHLAPLKRLEQISSWYDREIKPGMEREKEIEEQISTAHIILLLISPDFINSDYCYSQMQKALELRKAGQAHVIPIMLRPVDSAGIPITELQKLPDDGKSITTWSNRDQAFKLVTQGIRNVIESKSTPSQLPQKKDKFQSTSITPSSIPLSTETNMFTRNRGKLPKRHVAFVLLTVFLIFLLVVGYFTYHFFFQMSFGSSATKAVVTITPMMKDLKSSYTISAVTGTPDASKQQVRAHWLSRELQQKQMQQATGVGKTLGTHAKGILQITNYSSSTIAFDAGTEISNNMSPYISMVLDQSATIGPVQYLPPNNFPLYATASVPAHVLQIGVIGNMPAGKTAKNSDPSFSYEPSDNSWIALNDWNTPFTGGTDTQSYVFVQQSDINEAMDALTTNMNSKIPQIFQGQIHPNERLIGTPQCDTGMTSDHAAGDIAQSVTVVVTLTCKGEVYDFEGAQALAEKLLNNQASTDLSTGYRLVGKIVTKLSQEILIDANQGTVVLTIVTEGRWVYQFGNAQKLLLAQLIAGKNKKDAQFLLLNQSAIDQVDIHISGSNENTLPTDLNQISIIIQTVQAM